MKIPNSEFAIVDIRKLRNYCLNPTHDEGKHKARLFSKILGMTAKDAESLRIILLKKIKTEDNARIGRVDEYGQRYILDFLIDWHGKQAMVRSGWIIEHAKKNPKLTTCYIL